MTTDQMEMRHIIDGYRAAISRQVDLFESMKFLLNYIIFVSVICLIFSLEFPHDYRIASVCYSALLFSLTFSIRVAIDKMARDMRKTLEDHPRLDQEPKDAVEDVA